jgi:hypothetical protein
MTTRTYRLSHPQLSEPIELDDAAGRDEQSLVNWASMWVLRNYDVMPDRSAWTIEEVR